MIKKLLLLTMLVLPTIAFGANVEVKSVSFKFANGDKREFQLNSTNEKYIHAFLKQLAPETVLPSEPVMPVFVKKTPPKHPETPPVFKTCTVTFHLPTGEDIQKSMPADFRLEDMTNYIRKELNYPREVSFKPNHGLCKDHGPNFTIELNHVDPQDEY